MGLREVTRFDVVNGRWVEIRELVSIQNPENRLISKVRDELVPESELTDTKTWYDESTDENKKHILDDAGIQEEQVRPPDSQNLPPEIRDKVGEDYDYLTENEKLMRLERVGVTRKKFPPDSFDELSENAQYKISRLFEQERKIAPTEQWPILSIPDVVFEQFLEVLKRMQATTTRVLIGSPKRAEVPKFFDSTRLELKKLGAKDIHLQEVGPWIQSITATLKDTEDKKTLYERLQNFFPHQFDIKQMGEDEREIFIVNLTGYMQIPINPSYYDKLSEINNELVRAWMGETGQSLPELPTQIDPRTVQGAVLLNTETDEQGIVRSMSGQDIVVSVLPTGKIKQWPLSKLQLLREGLAEEPRGRGQHLPEELRRRRR